MMGRRGKRVRKRENVRKKRGKVGLMKKRRKRKEIKKLVRSGVKMLAIVLKSGREGTHKKHVKHK